MFKQLRTSVRRWRSLCMGTWLSVLSWMHWRLTRTQREREQTELLEQMQRRQLYLLDQLQLQEQLQRQLLLEALRPLAAALQRQDSLHQQRQEETKALLLEVLNSLQPAVRDQIFLRIGPPAQKIFSPSSGS